MPLAPKIPQHCDSQEREFSVNVANPSVLMTFFAGQRCSVSRFFLRTKNTLVTFCDIVRHLLDIC